MTVETITDASFSEDEEFESVVQGVDLVCVTDWDRDSLVSANVCPYET